MKEKQQEQKDEKQTNIPVSLIHDLTTFALYRLLRLASNRPLISFKGEQSELQ